MISKLTTLIENVKYQRRKLFYPRDSMTQRLRIEQAVRSAGIDGMTRDQIVVATGIPLQSVTWRVSELRKYGVLFDQTPEGQDFGYRFTRQGCMARILIAKVA